MLKRLLEPIPGLQLIVEQGHSDRTNVGDEHLTLANGVTFMQRR
jgi:hypothetical protein